MEQNSTQATLQILLRHLFQGRQESFASREVNPVTLECILHTPPTDKIYYPRNTDVNL